MESKAVNINALPSVQNMQDILTQGSSPGVGAPSESFSSVLSKFAKNATPHLVSGGEEYQPADFRQMRNELATQIKDAMKSGDPEGKLASLQEAYDKINQEARLVASRAFDSALARLTMPEQDLKLASIKMGKYAEVKDAIPAATAKAKPEIAIPGETVAVPPMVDVDKAIPERDVQLKMNQVPHLAPTPSDSNLHSSAPIFPSDTASLAPSNAANANGVIFPGQGPEDLSGMVSGSVGSSQSLASGAPVYQDTQVPNANNPVFASSSSGFAVRASGAPTPTVTAASSLTLTPSTVTAQPSFAPAAFNPGTGPTGQNNFNPPGTGPTGQNNFNPLGQGPITLDGDTGAKKSNFAGQGPPSIHQGGPSNIAPPNIIIPTGGPSNIAPPHTGPGIPTTTLGGTAPPNTIILGGANLPNVWPPGTHFNTPSAQNPITTTGVANSGTTTGTTAQGVTRVEGRTQIPQPKIPAPIPGKQGGMLEPNLVNPASASGNVAFAGNVGAFNVEYLEKTSSNPFGVSDAVWHTVTQNDKTNSALKSFPDKAVALYKEASPDEKLQMSKQINEKTKVFLFTIDNREAFISGKVMGRDTFDYLLGSLDSKWKQGQVTDYDKMRQESALNILRTLSTDQREGYVNLLNADTQSVAVNS